MFRNNRHNPSSYDSMSDTQIKEWFRQFKDGRVSMDSLSSFSKSSMSKTEENVRSVINKNHRLTMRELEENLGILKIIVSQILTEDLGMSRVIANLFHECLWKIKRILELKLPKISRNPLTKILLSCLLAMKHEFMTTKP